MNGRTTVDTVLLQDVEMMLHWALDIIDWYDAQLVARGDLAPRVYSDVHLAGKTKARQILATLVGVAGCCGLGDSHG